MNNSPQLGVDRLQRQDIPFGSRLDRRFVATYPRLATLAQRFDVFLVDVWGVLIDGQQCMSGVPDALDALIRMGKSVVLITNSSRRAAEVTQLLQSMRLLPAASFPPVLSSGELAYEAISVEWAPYSPRVWVVGQQPGSNWIYEAGCPTVSGPADADVVFAWGIVNPAFKESLHDQLAAGVAMGLPMVCSNPDRAVHVGASRYVTAGTAAALYQELGGNVRWFGKPDPHVFRRAAALAGRAAKDRVVVIGDSLDTDVAGACSAGYAAVLVSLIESRARAELPLHAVLPKFAC